jgi:hypothetical protein
VRAAEHHGLLVRVRHASFRRVVHACCLRAGTMA